MIVDILLVLASLAGLAAAVLGYTEVRARRRVGRLREADEAVTSPIVLPEPVATGGMVGEGQTERDGRTVGKGGPEASESSEVPREAAVYAAAAGGVSLYEVYAAAGDHRAVLDVLKHRYNGRLADVESPLDWLGYFAGKGPVDGKAARGVVSGYVGQVAEDHTVEALNSLPALKEAGITARQFDSRTHPSDDIGFFYEDGTPVPDEVLGSLSVKSYGSKDSFYRALDKSDSSRYVVNRELYEELRESGGLDELAESGVEVVEGVWSHLAETETGMAAMEALTDAADLSEKVPLIGMVMMVGRVGRNVKRRADGAITNTEMAVDTAFDGARILSGGAGGFAGAKAGAIVGTWIFPGPGTVIGGGIGTLVGAVATGSAFRSAKEWVKYGTITSALDELSRTYRRAYVRDGGEAMARLRDAFYDWPSQAARQASEAELVAEYGDEVRVYAWRGYRRPSPMGALARRHSRATSLHAEAATDACRTATGRLRDRCVVLAGGDAELGHRTFAATLAARSDLFRADLEVAERYLRARERYPRHPYQLRLSGGEPVDPDVVLQAAVAEGYTSPDVKVELPATGRLVGWALGLVASAALLAGLAFAFV